MKRIQTDSANILDLGEVLVIVPFGIAHDLDAGNWLDGQIIKVGGFTRRTTRAGREAVEVVGGIGYELRLREGSGDRTWSGWDCRRPVQSVHGAVFAHAVATSKGGGCWFEATISPSAGFITAYEREITDELLTV